MKNFDFYHAALVVGRLSSVGFWIMIAFILIAGTR